MKKIAIMLMFLAPFASMAQKEIKPSIANAEKALRAGKLDEAKAIIDVTTTSQEFMVDKKGAPSKNAAKAWYLKGLIYAGIDTTSVEKYKSLVQDGFPIAKEAFEKSKQIDNDKTASFVNDAMGFPMIPTQVNGYLAQSYFDKALKAYQEEKNYKKAFEFTERTLYFIPEDTSILMNAGVFFGPAAEEWDKSINYLNAYLGKGGKNSDAYIMLIDLYYNKKKNTDEALNYAKKAKELYPNNPSFKQNELSIYLGLKKYDVAKKMVEDDTKTNPNDKENYFMLGQLNVELGDINGAKSAFAQALKIDPKYFDAATRLADLYWKDAKVVKDQMNSLGNSKADMAKLQELDKEYVSKLTIALPYIEACEKISPDDINVLYSLLTITSDLDMQDKVQRIKKRLKALGEEVD